MAGLSRPPLALTGLAARLPPGIGPAPVGRGVTGPGGFVDADPRRFDPDAFGLTDREAATLDPLHRWLLETTRALLETSGTPAGSLPADRTGVFVGIGASEFVPVARRVPVDEAMYVASGTGAGAAAGRLAYTFGWRGEGVAIDTACSSGLVALHLGCRAVWDGRLDAVVVAAANVLLDPEIGPRLAVAGLTSPTGALRSFGPGADGYVRGEGCVAVLIRRVPRPEDQVLAWVLGTAANHGGSTNGLTAPSPRAEREVLRAALAHAGRAPSDVGYHEGHGSGTALGDAVELEAIDEVFAGVDDLRVGSIKARIGHLEAAAGLAGLAAAVEVLRTGTIAPTGPGRSDRVASQPTALPRPVVTVSSFGLGGTNAAAVLGAAPPASAPAAPAGPEVIRLSADSPAALERWVGQWLGHAGPRWRDRCASTAARSGRRVRVAAVADPADAARALTAAARVDVGVAPPVGWVFPGFGAAWVGMGRSVTHPAFREAVDRLVRAEPDLGRVFTDDGWAADPRWATPGTFAVSYGLAQVLRAWGVRPAVVAGHSGGEVTAAVVAGALSPEDGLALSIAREELRARSGPGRVAVVSAGAEEVADHLPPGVEVAAENTARETLISGTPEAFDAALAALSRWTVRELPLRHGMHAAALEPWMPALAAEAARLDWRVPEVPIVDHRGPVSLAPAAWADRWRAPVRFRGVIAALRARGALAVDLGPHPVLAAMVAAEGGPALGSLRRDQPEDGALAQLHVDLWLAGVDVEPAGAWPGYHTVAVPPTPLVPRPCWPEAITPLARVGWTPATPGPAEPLPDLAPGAVDRGARWVAFAPEAPPIDAARWVVEVVAPLATRPDPPPLVVVAGPPSDGASAAIAGAVRAAAREIPGLRWTVVHAETADRSRWAAAATIPNATVRVGEGTLTRAELEPWRPRGAAAVDGVWIVTGGGGGIGAHVARWLTERGAARVVRVGRTGPDLAVDLAGPGAVAELLARVGPVSGVVHAAGVVRDGPVHALDPASFAATFGPKVDPAEAFAALLPPEVPLVCVSSLAGVTGASGQVVYAAANAALDAVARRRSARGGRAVSIAYGPWADTGMARGRSWARVTPLSVEQGLAALDAALAGDEAVVVAAVVPPEVEAAPLPVDRAARIVEHARRVLQRSVDPDRPLVDQGLDSILAVQLRNRLLADGIDAPLFALTSGSLASLLPAPAPTPAPARPVDGAVWAAGFVGAVFGALGWALAQWLTG